MVDIGNEDRKVKLGGPARPAYKAAMPRPTLLLLPGLLCDARLWRDQVAALQDAAECRVADLTLDDSLDAMADRALRDTPGRFAVCGLSMGGYVALALMRRAPGRVTRLCLMDTGARPDTEAQARRSMQTAGGPTL